MKPAVQVEGLSKEYRLGSSHGGGYRTLREAIASSLRFPRGREEARDTSPSFWALKDVSFDIQPGEVVGLIGRNGAGKSTILKVLSRITEPTSGRAVVRGRLASLLEVGTGFHPELSGRENIYLNGSILGMTRREIKRKFDEIVAFSEIEQFLDTPVKRYSSGMYVRLAFAVAAHLDPDILIVDEVLAVGDAEFQKKCLARMRTVAQTGHTVLLVSHNLASVEGLCDKALTLHKGQLIGFGDAREQIRLYISRLRSVRDHTVDLANHPLRAGRSVPILKDLSVTADGVPGTTLPMGGSLGFDLRYEMAEKPRYLRIGIVIETMFGVRVVAFSPTFQCPHLLQDTRRAGTVRVQIPWLNLVEGDYYVNVYAQTERGWDTIEQACQIQVLAADVFKSGATLDSNIAATFLHSEWTIGS